MSIITNTDSYKLSHFAFYPPGTTEVYSYFESRGGKYLKNVFFGLQPLLELLAIPITMEDILEAEAFSLAHGLPFNKAGWLYILQKHNGFLPVEIKAVPEGSVIPYRNVLMTVKNTDPEVPWLTSYLETPLVRVWYPSTVATRIFNMKRKLKAYFNETSDEGNMDFALLDFSSRGCSSLETNELGGAAYLTLFKGSDSIPAVVYTNKHYHSEMSGFSVPATEHSIMTGYDDEFASFEHLVEVAEPGSILSVVCDTWNVYEAAEKWVLLKDKLSAKNITLVVRPDSGEIEDVLPKVLKTLEKGFGSTVNKKGFKVLNGVKVLWGDGINEETCHIPFVVAWTQGISSDSIMVGSGGGLMQANIDRDTSKYAFKASSITIDGVEKGIAKNPITDPGKMSKKGKLSLIKDGENYVTLMGRENTVGVENELQTVFKNGKIMKITILEEIRKRLELNT